MHSTRDFLQLKQGSFLSHFTLRCAHRRQECSFGLEVTVKFCEDKHSPDSVVVDIVVGAALRNGKLEDQGAALDD